MDWDRKKLEIVVARYNEDLNWLNEFSPICSIYNKGCDDINVYPFEFLKLDNIGREGDTYLRHIIKKYPNFPEYTLFTQGNINDHVKSPLAFGQNIRDIMRGAKTDMEGYIGLSDVSVNNGWGEIVEFVCTAHADLPIRQWWDMFFDELPKNNRFTCNFSGIFIVSKERILYHSKEFYEELNKYLLETEPIGGYVLERLWTTIFDGETHGKYDDSKNKHSLIHNNLKKRIQQLHKSLNSILSLNAN